MRLKADPRLRFAGQITGCEGYVESAAIGLLAGRMAAAERLGQRGRAAAATTAIGALVNHITGGHLETIDAGPRSFQPMNVNFGLFPPLDAPSHDASGKRIKGKERGQAASAQCPPARWPTSSDGLPSLAALRQNKQASRSSQQDLSHSPLTIGHPIKLSPLPSAAGPIL